MPNTVFPPVLNLCMIIKRKVANVPEFFRSALTFRLCKLMSSYFLGFIPVEIHHALILSTVGTNPEVWAVNKHTHKRGLTF
jgi:hypothetical protein